MRDEFKNEQNWKSRGFLPHYDASLKYQMITYRLADSLPQKVLNSIKESKGESLKQRILVEDTLDEGHGACILKIPKIAQIVIDAWKFFDKSRYDLIAYVVMPNHVHVLIKTYEKHSLSQVIHSWKSYTAHEIKKVMGKAGIQSEEKIWQVEYWDRFIRDEKHFTQAVNYIIDNPVKAGLCTSPEQWPWSSYVSQVDEL